MDPQKKWQFENHVKGKMDFLNHWILWDPICRQSQGCSERLKWANLNKAAGWLSFLPQPSGPRNTALLRSRGNLWF